MVCDLHFGHLIAFAVSVMVFSAVFVILAYYIIGYGCIQVAFSVIRGGTCKILRCSIKYNCLISDNGIPTALNRDIRHRAVNAVGLAHLAVHTVRIIDIIADSPDYRLAEIFRIFKRIRHIHGKPC